MQRREFITLLGSAAAAPMVAPRITRAQQPAMPVIGYLTNGTPEISRDTVQAFLKGLSEAGFTEGRNVTIEYAFGNDRNDRLPALAADLVRRRVAVIIGAGVSAAVAAKAATTTIPVVFNMGVDPVERGFVTSLSHLGGNLTGVANLNVALEPKRLELLREVVPKATAIGLLFNPTNPIAATLTGDVKAAARTLGIELHILPTAAVGEIDTAFATLVRLQAGGLVIGNDGLFINRAEQVGALSVRYAIPTIFQYPEFTAAGGLMSYGGSRSDPYRLVAIYAARILKGENPADLPVQQSTKTDLIINLKTAKALGLTVPLALLGRADEVIE